MKYEIQNTKHEGFTLMEIVVSTTIFIVVFMALLSLFNYTLKINRKSEALKQASQGMRNFVEFLVKEVRNGQIDYYVSNGQSYTSSISPTSPCRAPGTVGDVAGAPGTTFLGASTYGTKENKLGIVNADSAEECFYLGNSDGSYVDVVGGAATTFSVASGGTLVMQKAGVPSIQILNPPNFRIDKLAFFIRPLCDPYTVKPPGCSDYSSGYPKVQPFVSIYVQATVGLPTGEQVPIYYQTSVATNQNDIPNQ